MKKVLCTGLIGLVLTGSLLAGSPIMTTNAKTIKATAQKASVVKVTTKQSTTKNTLLESKIKLPVISGMKNKTMEKKLNLVLEKDATSFKNSIAKNAKDDYEYAKEQGYEFRPYNAYTDYKVGHLGSLISLTVDYYSYTGGAHGSTNRVGYNFDAKTGRNLILKDLFKPGTNFKNVIKASVKKSIKADPSIYFSDADKTVDKLPDNQTFYINNGNLVVVFGQYEIAPYAAGIREFKIPYSSIKGMVKDEYKSNF